MKHLDTTRSSWQALIALTLCAAMHITSNASAHADDYTSQPTGGLSHRTVVSDNLLQLRGASVDSLKLEGEQALHFGNFDKAITVLHKALELAPSNTDSRTLYTDAMEGKLRAQKNQDPKLYNAVVKQWVFIYKNSDQDQRLLAQKRLQELTGIAPPKLKSLSHYLDKVTIPEDGSTQVAIGGRPKTQ
jgi:hypothetical protein